MHSEAQATPAPEAAKISKIRRSPRLKAASGGPTGIADSA